MQKFIRTKKFAESTQLNDEEMQAALARKNRWLKFKNFMKTLGGIGLGAAALYGGAKWYQNGGRGFVQNMLDQGADFTSKVGDTAVDTAKGIGNATVDEANRVVDQLAENRVTSNGDQIIKGNQEVTTTPDQTNADANQVVDAVTQGKAAQPEVAQENTTQDPAQVNADANTVTNQVTEGKATANESTEAQSVKLDPMILNQANNIYLNVMNSNDVNEITQAIEQLNQLAPGHPELVGMISNLQSRCNLLISNQQFMNKASAQTGDTMNEYMNQMDAYKANRSELAKFKKGGLDPSKYGVQTLTKPEVPVINTQLADMYVNQSPVDLNAMRTKYPDLYGALGYGYTQGGKQLAPNQVPLVTTPTTPAALLPNYPKSDPNNGAPAYEKWIPKLR